MCNRNTQKAKPITSGACKLCGNKTEFLQESHILPKFVIRWLKNTSATGHIRYGRVPNKRVQDGLKRYWLCESCEELLSKYETIFANTVFHPHNNGNVERIQYGEWLLKFCVSISWRVLLAYKEEFNALSHYDEIQIRHVENALKRWRLYLLNQVVHPNQYEQHLLPLDVIASHVLPGMPTNINRYFLQAVDMDVAKGEQSIFVYSKLGRFLVIGFVNMQYPRQWIGTKVHLKRGVLEPTNYILPDTFGEYLLGRAKNASRIQKSISSTQQEKIDMSYRNNIDKAAKSETVRAMQRDFEMFGDEAFGKESK